MSYCPVYFGVCSPTRLPLVRLPAHRISGSCEGRRYINSFLGGFLLEWPRLRDSCSGGVLRFGKT